MKIGLWIGDMCLVEVTLLETRAGEVHDLYADSETPFGFNNPDDTGWEEDE